MIKKGERTKKAPLPFTTSTLQQEASKALNFATSKDDAYRTAAYMKVWILKDSGTVGLITYLRTDSTRISEEADAACKSLYCENLRRRVCGRDASDRSRKMTGKRFRMRTKQSVRQMLPVHRQKSKNLLHRDQFRLYQLIWKRFVASRMQPAKYETTSVKIGADDYRFTVSASKIIFEGFRLVYVESDEEKTEWKCTGQEYR